MSAWGVLAQQNRSRSDQRGCEENDKVEYFKEGENRPTMVEGGKQQLEHCVVVGVLGGFLPRIGGVYVVCGDNGEVLLPTKESASELLGKACQGRAHATRRVGDGNVDRLLLSSGIGGIHKKHGRWRRRRYDVGGQVCSLTWGDLSSTQVLRLLM
jgi:hypothetical protein